MRIISHRGNLTGIEPTFENRIKTIDKALAAGFDVEVDVLYHDNKMFLGHDAPQELLPERFYSDDRIHFHCKNMGSLMKFQNSYRGSILFTHDKDEATITSRGMLWIHPLTLPNLCDIVDFKFERAIAVLPEIVDIGDIDFLSKFYGICTDYPERYKEALDNV
jgi:hypothetical protein